MHKTLVNKKLLTLSLSEKFSCGLTYFDDYLYIKVGFEGCKLHRRFNMMDTHHVPGVVAVHGMEKSCPNNPCFFVIRVNTDTGSERVMVAVVLTVMFTK